jgi:hypothetical protein
MDAKIIAYDLSKLDHYHKVLLNRALFGFTDNSNSGAYVYQRKGILKDIQHKRLTKGTLIVKMSGANKVISVLKKHKAKFYAYDISVNQSILK